MLTGNNLLEISSHFAPDFDGQIEWADIWERPISNGASFEWTTLAAIIYKAKEYGWEAKIPILEYENGSKLFKLRNEIPAHHNAQAGHSATMHEDFSLTDRFIQSLIPKYVLSKGKEHYSIFREGCPYHKIMLGKNYDQRPDILFLKGALTPGYPKLDAKRNFLHFSFDLELLSDLSITGTLRIINSQQIPCIRRSPREKLRIPIAGLIEVSTNKSSTVAIQQLAKYRDLFNTEENGFNSVLVTGNQIEQIALPYSHVDIGSSDIPYVKSQFEKCAELILKSCGIA